MELRKRRASTSMDPRRWRLRASASAAPFAFNGDDSIGRSFSRHGLRVRLCSDLGGYYVKLELCKSALCDGDGNRDTSSLSPCCARWQRLSAGARVRARSVATGRYRGAREVLQAAQCSPRENERFSIMAIVAHRHRPGLL
nr:uncharacterized protein LOC112937913 [Oryza sativa Japonica Group]